MDREEAQTLLIRITGRVQGVGFRAWTRRQAMALDLSGWVRNEDDGSVRAFFQGEPDSLREITKRLREGPAGAAVSRIEREDDAGREYVEGFEVRY